MTEWNTAQRRARRASVFSLGNVSVNFGGVFGASRAHRTDPAENPRRVFVNVPPDGEWADDRGRVRARYATNAVHSSKYTLVTFIPKVGPFQQKKVFYMN